MASRRLKAGQEVMEDQPLTLGPLALTLPVCLGCHSPVPLEMPRCPGCWWPLCSPECATSSLHQQECQVLAKDTERVAPPREYEETARYDIIMMLRVLLLRSSDPEGWAVVCGMEHHSEKRREGTELELEVTAHLVQDVFGLDYTVGEVEQVRGAILTNAMQIRSPTEVSLRVLHPRVRLFNHSCSPNLQLSFTDDAVMLVRTAVPMEVGDPLLVTYTGTTMPLWERHAILKENYFFNCECSRCHDPTEMGTNFSNPRCPECYWNIMQPRTWLGVTKWVCQNCKGEKSEERVRDEARASLSCLEMSDVVEGKSFRRMQYLLDQMETDYHPMHYVWMKVAQRMLHRLQDDETDRGLKLRVGIWRKLTVLYGKLEPGLTRRRGEPPRAAVAARAEQEQSAASDSSACFAPPPLIPSALLPPSPSPPPLGPAPLPG